MAKTPKKRKVYLLDWYDIEGDAGWGEGAQQPPLVHQLAFILSWPRKNQKVPCYRVATAFVEEEPGGATIIPASVVRGKPQHIHTVTIAYRTPAEKGL